jgi:prepilin-type N-terminal cleavage/methylation domain-containing protein
MSNHSFTAGESKACSPWRVTNRNINSAVRSDALGTTRAKGKKNAGFTLAELLVSVSVLVLLVLLSSQLLKSTATITTLGHKQMEAESQARQVLDRMAVDIAQMVKRSDVDYYVKSSWFVSGTPPPPPGITPAPVLRAVLQPGNDQIAFYSSVPGYYLGSDPQSSVSLVTYRVYNPSPAPSPCSHCNKLQRLGKGLVWNAVSTTDTPVVFMPIPVASPLPTPELPPPTTPPVASPTPAWPQAGNMNPDAAYELVGPQVFRFEYYYLLKNGTFSDDPMISNLTSPHSALSGMQDVSAIVVDVAVIDPKSKVLLDTLDPTNAKLRRLNGADGQVQGPALIDWGSTSASCSPSPCPNQQQWQQTPGLLPAQWRAAIDSNAAPNGIALPPPVISGIRVYERVIYLSPPTGL